MKRAPSPSGFRDPFRSWTRVLLPAGALAAGVWALGSSWDAAPLEAADMVAVDTDHDGLPDRQEPVFGTDPHLPDTDFDGFSDGEEVALHTSPLKAKSSPKSSGLSVALSARGEGGKLKLFVVVLVPDGVLSDKNLRFGAMIKGQVGRLPVDASAYSNVEVSPGLNGGLLCSLDVDLPDEPFKLSRSVTYFAVVGREGETGYAAAAKVDLRKHKHGIVMLRQVLSEPGDPPAGDPLVPVPGSSVSYPIPPSGDGAIPVDWKFGEVCYQQSQITGASGAVVTHEVTSAECVEGWETYCASDCASSAGTTYTTIDTGVLLGG